MNGKKKCGPDTCPVCKSTETQGINREIVDDVVIDEFVCNHCGAGWEAVYTLHFVRVQSVYDNEGGMVNVGDEG